MVGLSTFYTEHECTNIAFIFFYTKLELKWYFL